MRTTHGSSISKPIPRMTQWTNQKHFSGWTFTPVMSWTTLISPGQKSTFWKLRIELLLGESARKYSKHYHHISFKSSNKLTTDSYTVKKSWLWHYYPAIENQWFKWKILTCGIISIFLDSKNLIIWWYFYGLIGYITRGEPD